MRRAMSKKIDELGGSCIITNVRNKRRDTDYDGYNDYQSIITERGWEDDEL